MSLRCKKINGQSGFSLIEILIVLAIVALLVALVMPGYRSQVRKSSRTEAYSKLNEILLAQERYFVENKTYTNDLTELSYSRANRLPTEQSLYFVSASDCDGGSDEKKLARCVLITATANPETDQINDVVADVGPDLSINSRGRKEGHW